MLLVYLFQAKPQTRKIRRTDGTASRASTSSLTKRLMGKLNTVCAPHQRWHASGSYFNPIMVFEKTLLHSHVAITMLTVVQELRGTLQHLFPFNNIYKWNSLNVMQWKFLSQHGWKSFEKI